MTSLAVRNQTECMVRDLKVAYVMSVEMYSELLKGRHARHLQVVGTRSPWGFNVEFYGQTLWIRLHACEEEVIRVEFFGGANLRAKVPRSLAWTVRKMDSLCLAAFLKQVVKGGGS
jgi:hypothetical protein